MQRIKKLQSGGFYAIQICASANSAIVERVYQAKKFLQLINSRLEGFAKVHDYLISNGGIFLVLEIQDSNLILDKYLKIRKRSKKANREFDHEEIWKIISEQFRHLISIYVKWFNKDTGRAGSMVARNYERFYFENVEEANLYITKMKNEETMKIQRLKKYRPSKRVNYLLRRMKKGMIFLCGKFKNLEILKEQLGNGSLVFTELADDVLRKLISLTINLNKPRKGSNYPALGT